jgi:hypothetical protein
MPPSLYASTTILLDPILVEIFDFKGDLPCIFLRRERERERKEEGPKALVPPFTRFFETDPSKIDLVIYKLKYPL